MRAGSIPVFPAFSCAHPKTAPVRLLEMVMSWRSQARCSIELATNPNSPILNWRYNAADSFVNNVAARTQRWTYLPNRAGLPGWRRPGH